MAIEQKDFTNNLFALLKEFFESPPTSGAACLDQKTGLCEHIRFYNDILIGGLQGKTYGKIDWKQSWLLQTVSDEAWKKLHDTLMQQYQALMALLESFETWDDYKVGDPMAIVAHTAYHLGAVRQLLRFV
jgi:hypothetical protein